MYNTLSSLEQGQYKMSKINFMKEAERPFLERICGDAPTCPFVVQGVAMFCKQAFFKITLTW